MNALNHGSTNIATGVGDSNGRVATVVDAPKTYSERLVSAMAAMAPPIDVAGLARQLGISYQAVRKVVDGARFGSDNNIKAARILNVRSEWLATGEPPRTNPPRRALHLATEELPEYAGRPKAVRRVPIVGTARMGDNGFYEEISAIPGAGDGHIDIASGDPDAYGLRVRGSSMAPAIRDGWYVLIEPAGQVVPGEFVLVKLRDGRKMVKELLYERPESIEVLSVNNGERLTVYRDELDSLQAVAAVVSPSKWQPQ